MICLPRPGNSSLLLCYLANYQHQALLKDEMSPLLTSGIFPRFLLQNTMQNQRLMHLQKSISKHEAQLKYKDLLINYIVSSASDSLEFYHLSKLFAEIYLLIARY